MNTLLLLFALPVATIILAIVLQKILKCPLLVAATFFAIYLVVTYAAFDSSFFVYAILYTILAYVTAILTKLICEIISRFNLNNDNNCICNSNNDPSYSTSNATWCCTSRNNLNNVARIGINATNGNCNCCNDNSTVDNNTQNDPVIVLTNENTTGRGKNNCNRK